MDLLPKSLKDLLSDPIHNLRAISVKHVQNLAWQLCVALEFLRSKSIIHADIRPENVLVETFDECGRVKVKLA